MGFPGEHDCEESDCEICHPGRGPYSIGRGSPDPPEDQRTPFERWDDYWKDVRERAAKNNRRGP